MKIKNILDDKNQYLISQLLKDGRIKYTTLAKELKVTPAAVKERVEKLIEKKIIKISALVNLQKLYPLAACIGVETDADGVNILIRKLRNCPLVLSLIKTSGNHNLIINVVGTDIALIDDFINKQIRSEPGIKHVEVNLGNTISLPEFVNIKLFYPKNNEAAPCGLRVDDETRCLRCPAFSKE
ncbi:MAG: Lrp/AsnC family transcriptional regulator [Candidatus Aenigmarchaeota archaeon]|nr:Lrp/AsnC family transcriptional regulator [Candidatus Aenigmarchaeota archaeon]